MDACFQSEQDLVQQFEEVADRYSDKFTRSLEFNSDNGIADVVLFELRKNWEAQKDIGKISPRWAYTLKSLQYRKFFSVDDFQSLTRVSRKTALQVLQSYLDAGYCDASENRDRWIKYRQPALVAKKVYAIEAKLDNWKRALHQATRYKDYADQSWVLLDKASIGAALKNQNLFGKHNIGLASISVAGDVDLLIKPEKTPPTSEFARWYVNAKLASYL